MDTYCAELNWITWIRPIVLIRRSRQTEKPPRGWLSLDSYRRYQINASDPANRSVNSFELLIDHFSGEPINRHV